MARFESETTGKITFCFDLNAGEDATFAEIEGEAEFSCKFGEDPSGYGIHFDPGSGDEINFTGWFVDTCRKNPAWVKGEENPGISYHLHERRAAPEWLVKMMTADAKFMADLDEQASESARNGRERA